MAQNDIKGTQLRRDRRVLLISYLFPPAGGAGVQRSLKYVKYLPEFDWNPVVLTVDTINYYVYEESLLSEVPPGVEIVRTGSLDPLRLSAIFFPPPKLGASSQGPVKNQYFTQSSTAVQIYRKIRNVLAFPDAQLGWIPFAYRKGLEAIRKHDIQTIVATIEPYSSAIVAHLLSKKTGIPYVLDFRDGWIDDPYHTWVTSLHRWGHACLERLTVTNASAITVYGKYLADRLGERYPEIASRISILPNGFDPDDLHRVVPIRTDGTMHRLVYMGSLYAHHEENLRALIAACKSLSVEVASSIEVLFVGQAYIGAQELVTSEGMSETIKFLGYRSHNEALSLLSGADAGLLFVRAGDVSSVTGKVFEYLMVNRPIIACAEPNGACAEVLRQAGQGEWITVPNDAQRLADNITALAARGWPRPGASEAQQFSRKYNTERLASILNGLCQ